MCWKVVRVVLYGTVFAVLEYCMKITLLVVGKTTDSHLQALINDYEKRLLHYVPFSLQVIPELKNAKSLRQEQQKQAEGELILKAVDSSAMMVLLDEHGREYRSVDFAKYVNKLQGGGRNVTFVVGGPYGFSDAVYQRAEGKISLSQMTFSHQMIRFVFIEQLYRAMTILKGEPYHHE